MGNLFFRNYFRGWLRSTMALSILLSILFVGVCVFFTSYFILMYLSDMFLVRYLALPYDYFWLNLARSVGVFFLSCRYSYHAIMFLELLSVKFHRFYRVVKGDLDYFNEDE